MSDSQRNGCTGHGVGARGPWGSGGGGRSMGRGGLLGMTQGEGDIEGEEHLNTYYYTDFV